MYYINIENEEGIFTKQFRYIKISPTSGSYIEASKDNAQGIAVNSNPYSINLDNPIPNISKAEIIEEENWNEEIKNKYNELKSQEAKNIKIPELSKKCNEAIDNGIEIELDNNNIEKFTYNIKDQANISEMANAVVLGAESYPYHSSNKDCRMYTSNEIIKIYSTLAKLKTHHLTYFNQLKSYVNSLTKESDVYMVEYGQELTGEYLEKYNNLMNQAQIEMNKVLNNMQKE